MTTETNSPDPADWLEHNRANWDERVPIHVGSSFYDIPAFLAGRAQIRSFELEEVGDVRGKRLLHLQCHIGTDTLDWARRGAVVTGLDFSQPAVEAATDLAKQIGAADARFVASNVYDAVEALGGQTYDIVYTGIGALGWLPDIDGWARVASTLVAPGGFLYLAEFHPVSQLFDYDDAGRLKYDYFDQTPHVWDEPGTYADMGAETKANVSVEFTHGLGEIVSALIAAGLRPEFLHEHDFTLFGRYRELEAKDGIYRLPAGTPRMPLMFSVKASKPV